MAKPQSTRNPIAFTPLPVTAFITLVFAALFTSLVTIHNVVPPAPKSPTPIAGINITEAWSDLQHLSNGFHPYNSHRNNEVRTWLLTRIDEILERNDVDFTTGLQAIGKPKVKPSNSAVHIYNDLESSLLFGSPDSSLAVAFTGENIIVYIRGSEDEDGMWWEEKSTYEGKGGVLVNAHFDSVPTGYGTTDDGVGVISILQLISYFTTPQHKPKRGVVALLNNGEEDFLNGAYVFSQHPISKFPHTFLNLEGAGAGGRATLFRTTDNEVTKFYRKSPHPFGTVVSADGFKQGLVRSQTDYIIFNGELGMRGLDVAFMEPRSRYHTVEDSTKYTSKDSLWHMLSAAIATMQGLTSDTSSTFEGKASVEGGVSAGQGSDTVWFDLFGRSFAVFELHTVFAVSVTLLVVTPLILIALNILLARSGKWYLFSRKGYLHSSDDDDWVVMGGWRGFFRIPIAIVASTAAVIGLAYLVMKVNPYIVYSSEYSLWTYVASDIRVTNSSLMILSQYEPDRLVRHLVVFTSRCRCNKTFRIASTFCALVAIYRLLRRARRSHDIRDQIQDLWRLLHGSLFPCHLLRPPCFAPRILCAAQEVGLRSPRNEREHSQLNSWSRCFFGFKPACDCIKRWEPRTVKFTPS